MLSGCGHAFSYRYRLTLEIETPEGIKTGSGVFQCNTTSSEDSPFKGFRGAGGRLTGEAISVDLGTRGLLFVLLSKSDKSTANIYALELPVILTNRAGLASDGRLAKPKRYEFFTDYMREVAAVPGKLDVAPDELPTLVRFTNIDDPKSVEKVDPANLAAFFGPGVSWRSITIEITGDPVTTGIEKRLVWVDSLKGSIGKGMKLPYDHLLNQINTLSFKQGVLR